nr:hypothetical protein [Tanacetum cinerariifolium]
KEASRKAKKCANSCAASEGAAQQTASFSGSPESRFGVGTQAHGQANLKSRSMSKWAGSDWLRMRSP